MKLTHSDASVHVFTFKDGLLSKIAHDLKIAVTDFEIDISEDKVKGRFDLTSLRVVCAQKNGVDTTSLSDGDKKKIEGQIQEDVLHTSRFPTVSFEAARPSIDDLDLDLALSLHGKTKTLSVSASQTESEWVARVTIHQPDFGIKPYKAAFGALKVKADLIVEFSIAKSKLN